MSHSQLRCPCRFGLWIGFLILCFPLAGQEVLPFRHLTTGNGLPQGAVDVVYQDAMGFIWLGTRNGLLRYDGYGFRHYQHDPNNPDSLSANVITAIGEDGLNRLWVGTLTAGLNRFERVSQSFTRYQNPAEGPGPLTGNRVSCIWRRKGTLLVGTGNGLNVLKENGMAFRQVRATHGLGFGNICVIAEDSAGEVLLGTWVGLIRFDGAQILSDLLGDGSPFNDTIQALHLDREKRLWVATSSSLYRLSPDLLIEMVFHHNPEKTDGLPARVTAIAPDKGGGLWVSTLGGGAGLYEAGLFKYFSHDGSSLDNHLSTVFADRSGVVWFGSDHNGVTRLDRGPVALNTGDQTTVHITDVLVGFVEQPLGLALAGKPFLTVAGEDRILSLSFSATNYAAPERNRYQYRLEGFEKSWKTTRPPEHRATYTYLDSGRYRFHVRAMDSSGTWSSKATTLDIQVDSPFWQSDWAGGVYLLLGILFLLALHLGHAKRLRVANAANAALRESEDRLKWALWGSGDGLWDWQLGEGRVHRTMLWEMLDYPDGEPDAPLHFQNDLIHEDDLKRMRDRIGAHLAGKTPYYEAEYRLRAKDGTWKWVLDRGKVTEVDEKGNPMRVAGTHKEITAGKEAEEKLRLAARVMESTNDAIFVVDLDFQVVQVNPMFRKIMGYNDDEVLGIESKQLFAPRYGDTFFSRQHEQLVNSRRCQDEVWLKRKDGSEFLSDLYLSQVADENGQTKNYVAVFADITQRKQAEEDLRYLANFDVLTGLPNRTLFNERLERAMIRARRTRRKLALLFTDLDHFKKINDTLGHNVGDLLLRAVATRLSGCVRREDTVARLGGDEFLIILEEIETLHDVRAASEKVLEMFTTPYELAGHEVIVTISIGVSIFPDDGEDISTLFKNADTAMYHAKERGRNCYRFYSLEMNAKALRRLKMENLLRKAMARNELELAYQPKQDIASGRIVGAEVLLRWHNQDLGLVQPEEFIPIAEESGLIVPIGIWIIGEACRQFQQWRRRDLPRISLAINFSVRQLYIAEIITTLNQTLRETEVPPELIQLELTESLLIENAEAAMDLFKKIKRLGIGLALDDFGTGYSSLSYLRQFPIDTLKIDKAFIQDSVPDPGGEAIVRAIVDLAHSLHLLVVAEGVETEEQLEFLCEIQCDEYQGYLLSRPLSADAFETFTREQNALRQKK